MCGNVLCWKQNRSRGPCNEIRIIEFVLCILCFILTVHFVNACYMPSGVFLTLFCTILFVFITLVDIIVITAWFPIGWRAWIMISLTASLFFFTCTGLSFLIYHKLFFFSTIFFVITAIVFLIDCLCIIWLVQGCQELTRSRPCSGDCKPAQVVPINRTPSEVYATAPRRSTSRLTSRSASRLTARSPSRQASIHRSQQTQSSAQQTQFQGSSKYPEEKCHRFSQPTTHGGTFHMSKDTAPMPSPETVTITMSDTEVPEMDIEKGISKNSRSVSLMTKLMRKPQEVDLTPLKSPFRPDEEISFRKPGRRVRSFQLYSRNYCDYKCDSTTSNSPKSLNMNDSDADDGSTPKSTQHLLGKSKV